MPGIPRFGGDWTDEKLDRIRKYLAAYVRIFEANERARHFQTFYVDAFAGAGYRTEGGHSASEWPLPELADPDVAAFRSGSARIALQVEPPFHRYVFIERDRSAVEQLADLRAEFPELADRIEVVESEANDFVRGWCQRMDVRHERAVMFLDPFGMQVEWETITAIAATKAIDMWLLFPIGVGVNRLLTRRQLPPIAWADRLTATFGTDAWQDEFYAPSPQMPLFDEPSGVEKRTDFDRIGRFFIERLKTVFTGVAENPLVLRNSKNTPLYLLCFAAGNEKGAGTAIRIASHILKEAPHGRS